MSPVGVSGGMVDTSTRPRGRHPLDLEADTPQTQRQPLPPDSKADTPRPIERHPQTQRETPPRTQRQTPPDPEADTH